MRLLLCAVALAAVLQAHAAENLVTRSHDNRLVIRIFDQPCTNGEILKALGVVDGAFWRRAVVSYPDKTYEACWLTLISDDTVFVRATNLVEFTIPTYLFRTEYKA